jgi:hypothetical protein
VRRGRGLRGGPVPLGAAPAQLRRAVAPRLLPAYPFLNITDEVHMDNEFGLMGLATTISESVHRTIDASINHLPVLVCLLQAPRYMELLAMASTF